MSERFAYLKGKNIPFYAKSPAPTSIFQRPTPAQLQKGLETLRRNGKIPQKKDNPTTKRLKDILTAGS